MTIKIAVFNNKGGVGKTTLSIILTELALQNKESVVAIDQDEQNNFNKSISYLRSEPNFRKYFTLYTSIKEEYLHTSSDWLIVDCPPAFNDRSRLAIKNADLIVIPVRPDIYSLEFLSEIREAAGDYKKKFQFPLVKIGFTEEDTHDKYQEAKIVSQQIRELRYIVIEDLPLYRSISANLSCGLTKWWFFGLSDLQRKPFEFLHIKLKLLYQKLLLSRQKEIKSDYDVGGYYDDPENPDIVIFGLRSVKK